MELSDLPPTIQLSAANYTELKAAVAKLQLEVAKGKFGEIVQTGDWVVDDSTVLEMKNIRLSRLSGEVDVRKNPLRVRGVSALHDFKFNGYVGTANTENRTALVLYWTESKYIDLVNGWFYQCLATSAKGSNSTVPVIEAIQSPGVLHFSLIGCRLVHGMEVFPTGVFQFF